MEKRRELLRFPLGLLSHIRFNVRKSRDPADVEKLAGRIKRIGYEETRAVWATPAGDGYEVFAGGTRLEAAKLAGLHEIPVLVHYGYTDEEISFLADLDNENDEYHTPVPVTDVWAEYARLYEEEGWTQENIARVKGVSQKTVSLRLKLHRLPERVKNFIPQGLLTEAHLSRIAEVYLEKYFTPWLSTEQVIVELAEKAVRDRKKNGEKSVRVLEADVAEWKAWIAAAKEIYEALEDEVTLYDFATDPPKPYAYRPKDAFVEELARRIARSLSAVREAELAVRRHMHENTERYRAYLEEKSVKLVLERARAEKVQSIVSRFRHGDAAVLVETLDDASVDLLLTDPPYGMAYESGRRWATKTPEKILSDDEGALDLLEAVLRKALPKLKEDAHVLVFCSWRGEPRVREVLENVGLNVKSSIVWIKEEHSAGDLKGSFAPRHERIVHAVKGNPEVRPRKPDVFLIPRARRELHPMEKPVDLLKELIECTTEKGDLVFDPFAGVASTAVAALELERDFVAFELDPEYYEKGRERLLRVAQEKVERDVHLLTQPA